MIQQAVPDRPTWANTWRFVVGIVVCLVIGWYAFAQGERVPILSGVDLAFHEASHFFTSFLPRVPYFAAGSIGQIAWPLGIGIAFLVINKDPLGAGLCFAWAGASAQNVSEYIADAPTMDLPLIGGMHDWNTILGPDHLDALDAAKGLSEVVWAVGLVLWVVGIGVCAWGPWAVRNRTRRLAADQLEGARAEASSVGVVSRGGWAVVPPWEDASPTQGQDPPQSSGRGS